MWQYVHLGRFRSKKRYPALKALERGDTCEKPSQWLWEGVDKEGAGRLRGRETTEGVGSERVVGKREGRGARHGCGEGVGGAKIGNGCGAVQRRAHYCQLLCGQGPRLGTGSGHILFHFHCVETVLNSFQLLQLPRVHLQPGAMQTEASACVALPRPDARISVHRTND